MAAQKRQSHLLNVAKQMPPLYHTIPGHDYSVEDSQVIRWIVSQPELCQRMFNKLRDSGYIVYDRETGKWQGADYDATEEIDPWDW